jgi:NAD(P)-dependent dehydrogenase (short-subunit alcohol dehydrogenase family)
MSYTLTNRTIMISGASSGLGAGFARICAKAGANVVIGARRVERVEALAGELGPSALAVSLDVTDEASVIAAYDKAEAKFGTVNGIIANAGIGNGGRATDVAVADLQNLIDTNLLGSFLVVREGAKRLIASGAKDRGDGRVVLIGSITAEMNGTGDAMYAASKAALAHLGRQFAKDWVRQGINVNTLQPGWIHTEINADWFATERGQAEIQSLNRRRLIDADALDDMVLFLMSDRSRYVTGSTFSIDDGQSL